MDLSSMHEAVRDYVRDGVESEPNGRAERGAIRTWRHRLPADRGEVRRLMPIAAAKEWTWAPSE